jgi:hypothetical protein
VFSEFFILKCICSWDKKNDFLHNIPDKLLHLNIFLNAYAPGSIIGHFRGDHRPRLFGGDGMQGSPSVAS